MEGFVEIITTSSALFQWKIGLGHEYIFMHPLALTKSIKANKTIIYCCFYFVYILKTKVSQLKFIIHI